MQLMLITAVCGFALTLGQANTLAAAPGRAAWLPEGPAAVQALVNAPVPPADLAELASRLAGRGPIEATFPAVTYSTQELGARQLFWISGARASRFQVPAVLRYATSYARMWVQEDLTLDARQLIGLGRLLEREIHPAIIRLLAIDSDPTEPPVDLVFASRLGGGVAGYYSPSDRLHPGISETSNGRRMILIDSELAGDPDRLALTVAHELQHLIHWELDANESTWLQEGFSSLIELQLGGSAERRLTAYLTAPDLQLNSWPLTGGPDRNYGGTLLFTKYLYDRFGPDFVGALAHRSEDGLEALDAQLHAAEWEAGRGRMLTAEALMMDWGLANLLQLDGGPYGYAEGDKRIPQAVSQISTGCRENTVRQEVHQFGFDYVRVQCDQAVTLNFAGAVSNSLIPTEPPSGQHFLWSNRGDLANTRLTRQFDFTRVRPPITLQFWTWYELEAGSDFVYLLASEDAEHWSFLETTSGTEAGDLLELQLGFGYTGLNRRLEWSRQIVDLSRYAGKRVTLRFEYVSDSARTGQGFLIDDLSLVEIGYRTDFEHGLGGWNSDGFVRISNSIPQDFRVSIVRLAEPATVEHLDLDASNRASVALQPGEEVVIVVMGAARDTRQPARYQIAIEN